MRLGNDIVDLEAAKGEHERFATRILSSEEWDQYQNAGSGARLLWSYWAAKEAAFKAYSQERPTRFAPLRWEVSQNFSEVRFGEDVFKLRLVQAEESVYAEVTDADWELVQSEMLSLKGEPSPEIQKREVRRLAMQLAASSLGLKPGALRVVKREGIPHLWDEEARKSYTLSLTHHGRYLAASLLTSPQAAAVRATLDTPLSFSDFAPEPGRSL